MALLPTSKVSCTSIKLFTFFDTLIFYKSICISKRSYRSIRLTLRAPQYLKLP